MNMILRTTITLPESLWQEARYYAMAKRQSLSGLVRESLLEKIGKQPLKRRSLLNTLAGSLKLGGKTPPAREVLYAGHIKQKMGN